MEKWGLVFGGLVIGLLVGGLGGTLLGGGAMMGAGAASGLSIGVCSTVQAAQQLELLTPQQVDDVLHQAAHNISGNAAIPDEQKLVGSAATCDELMAKLAK